MNIKKIVLIFAILVFGCANRSFASAGLSCQENGMETYCSWDNTSWYLIYLEDSGGNKVHKSNYLFSNSSTTRATPNHCSDIDGEKKVELFACPSADSGASDCTELVDSTYVSYTEGCDTAKQKIKHDSQDDSGKNNDRNPICDLDCNVRNGKVDCYGSCTDPDGDLVSLTIDRDDDNHGPIDYSEDFSARKSYDGTASYDCAKLEYNSYRITIRGEDSRRNHGGNDSSFNCAGNPSAPSPSSSNNNPSSNTPTTQPTVVSQTPVVTPTSAPQTPSSSVNDDQNGAPLYKYSSGANDYFLSLTTGILATAWKSTTSDGLSLKEAASLKMKQIWSDPDFLKMIETIEKSAPNEEVGAAKYIKLAESDVAKVEFTISKGYYRDLNKMVIRTELIISNKLIPLQDADGAIIQYPSAIHIFNARWSHPDILGISSSDVAKYNLDPMMKKLITPNFQASTGGHTGFWIQDANGKITKYSIDFVNPHTSYGTIDGVTTIPPTDGEPAYIVSDFIYFSDKTKIQLSAPEVTRTPITLRTYEVAQNLYSASHVSEFDGYGLEVPVRQAAKYGTDDVTNIIDTMNIAEIKGSQVGKTAFAAESLKMNLKSLSPALAEYAPKVLEVAGIVGTIYLVYDVADKISKGEYQDAACTTLSGFGGCYAGGLVSSPIAVAVGPETAGIGSIVVLIGGCVGGVLLTDYVCNGIITFIEDNILGKASKVTIDQEAMKYYGLDKITPGRSSGRILNETKNSNAFGGSYFWYSYLPVEKVEPYLTDELYQKVAKAYTSLIMVRGNDSEKVFVVFPMDGKQYVAKIPPSVFSDKVFTKMSINEFLNGQLDQIIIAKNGVKKGDPNYCPFADFNGDGIINIDDLEDYYNTRGFEAWKGGAK